MFPSRILAAAPLQVSNFLVRVAVTQCTRVQCWEGGEKYDCWDRRLDETCRGWREVKEPWAEVRAQAKQKSSVSERLTELKVKDTDAVGNWSVDVAPQSESFFTRGFCTTGTQTLGHRNLTALPLHTSWVSQALLLLFCESYILIHSFQYSY